MAFPIIPFDHLEHASGEGEDESVEKQILLFFYQKDKFNLLISNLAFQQTILVELK
jgi:hypothetical protein